MPNRFVYETVITIDHETGECRVDTSMRGIATELRRRGFKDITRPESAPYRRFVGQADQIKFRPPKGKPASNWGGGKTSAWKSPWR